MNLQLSAPAGVTRYAPSRRDASPAALGFGVVLVVLCLAQLIAEGWATAERGVPLAFTAVPLLAALVGMARFRDGARGPDIHDRQLDRIIAVGAVVAAATLLALAVATLDATRIDRLALPATVVAVLVSRFGTRRLWQLRAAPLTLVLLWPTPWLALEAALVPHLDPALVHGAIAGLVLATPLALGARGRRRGRLLAMPLGALGGAGVALLMADTDRTVGVPAVAATVILTLLLVYMLNWVRREPVCRPVHLQLAQPVPLPSAAPMHLQPALLSA